MKPIKTVQQVIDRLNNPESNLGVGNTDDINFSAFKTEILGMFVDTPDSGGSSILCSSFGKPVVIYVNTSSDIRPGYFDENSFMVDPTQKSVSIEVKKSMKLGQI